MYNVSKYVDSYNPDKSVAKAPKSAQASRSRRPRR